MTENISSHQSEEQLLGLQPKATWESSRALGQSWNDRIKEQSLFSARTTSKSYLDMLRKKLAEIASRSVIPAVAETSLRDALQNLGYRPETGFPDNDGRIPPARPGSITDLSSSRRISLIVDTNIKQARSMAQLASSENPVFLMTNPAWKLTRTGARKNPRGDWRDRWRAAGDSVGWQGAAKSQMVALKTSPIWKALGDGAGGFTDTISSAFPPFAFGSGLAWVNVSRKEWKQICDAEGINNGLEDVKNKALAATRAKTGAEPISPSGGISYKPTGEKSVVARLMPEYAADTSRRDDAYGELRRSMAEAQLADSEIRNGMARIERARKNRNDDLIDSIDISEAVRKYETALAKAKSDISTVYAKMSSYADDVRKISLPKNKNEQIAFDMKMQKLRDAAFKTRGIISDTRKAVAERVAGAIALLRSDIQED